MELVTLLLDHRAEVTAQNSEGQTTGHTAIAYVSNQDVVTAILKKGLDLETTDNLARTVLHEASGRGFPTSAGANINANDKRGWTAVRFAAACDREDRVELLKEKHAATDGHSHEDLLAGARLRTAIAFEAHLSAEVLLNTGVDVTSPDFEGRTAFHHAAYHGKDQFVKTLLDGGADVQARIIDSAYANRLLHDRRISQAVMQLQWITPLHNAAGKGHTSITKILLDYSADALAMGNEAYTPSYLAARGGHAEIVRMFLERGVPSNNNTAGHIRPPPLYWAGVNGHEGVVRLLNVKVCSIIALYIRISSL